MIGEDMGTQTGLLFSPQMFRFYFKDMYTRLLAIAHEYGMKVLMHSCGKNWEIVPDLLDAGVDVFQFDQPALYDMPRLAALFKERKAALWSPVDIQQILPTGDRAKIEAGARRMIDIFEGGLICKNYGDLAGIGVKPEWDMWAYDAICRRVGLA
jgi:uroporphyrinogen decarboxylase